MSKTITRIIDPPVTLERLTVAILIDGILASQQGSIENAEKYTVRSEEDVKFYEDIVKKAVGFAPERGDEISVVVMPFEDVAEIEEPVEEPTEYLPIILTVLKYLAPIVVAILFFLMVLKPLIRTLATPSKEQPGLPPAQRFPTEIESQARPKELATKERLIEWASKNPQEAAGVIKSWLTEQ
jgi:flagellar M-ring protein FliF